MTITKQPLLAIDIGNSNIVLGLYHENSWAHCFRIETVDTRTADEYAVIIRGLFANTPWGINELDSVVISSVVPQLTAQIYQCFDAYMTQSPLIIQHDLPMNISIKTHVPDKTGSDLIANAAAAFDAFKQACIIVDFGTATTFTVVNAQGELLGCAIAAGLTTTMQALVSRTSQLTNIAMKPPEKCIGKDTLSAMQAGLILGHLSLVEGLVSQMKTELSSNPCIIATGGHAMLLSKHTHCFDKVLPWLTLDGLRVIASYQHER